MEQLPYFLVSSGEPGSECPSTVNAAQQNVTQKKVREFSEDSRVCLFFGVRLIFGYLRANARVEYEEMIFFCGAKWFAKITRARFHQSTLNEEC
jgi:hypothetical protein